ncbi:MAG: glycine betaine ABC transporter substrate-binding protein, partial [Candidatus Sulfotelmatobacter sp.]
MLLAALWPLSSCAAPRSDRIVIGSKNFTESLILGELLAQQIEAHTHLKVERRFYLAGTYICQQALLAGRIDIYPEYTGT